MHHHDQQIQRAIDVLRDAKKRAEEMAQRPITDPVWGPWYRRSDIANVYEAACEGALEILTGEGGRS